MIFNNKSMNTYMYDLRKIYLSMPSDKPKGIIQPILIKKASTQPKPYCLEEEAMYFPHSMVRFSLGRYQLGINFNDPLILLN